MRLNASWLAIAGAPSGETRRSSRVAPSLAAAVAAIVGVAAQRARAAGTLDALREAIEAALDAATPAQPDPREADAAELPRIGDADETEEVARLRALFGRMQPG
jgi:hypothetical protein